MLSVVVTCKGVTPLLLNKMDANTLQSLLLGPTGKGSKTKERPTSTREVAEQKVHRDAQGNPGIPAAMLFACLVNAGQFVRLDGKRQVSSAKATTLPGFMSLEDTFTRLYDSSKDADVPAPWEVDLAQGRNPNGGEAVCICRPRFDLWRFTAHITIDTDQIGENVIRQLWDIAGKRIGIGDFRPQRRGIYGQFVVERWESDKSGRKAAE
jgi:hypothetical protein